MKAKDFRRRAWEHLGGSWTADVWMICLVITMLHMFITAATLVFAVVPYIVFSGMLNLSMAIITLKVVRGEPVRIENYFGGFMYFVTAFLIQLINFLFIFLWSLLFIVPGIIKTYSYKMTFFIFRDNPDISFNEARKRSVKLMKGNKWKFFCLQFSFTGWYILCFMTFGILYLWVKPYINTAYAEFYQSLIDKKAELEEVVEPAAQATA